MLQHIRKPFVAFSALAAVLAMTGCQGNGGGTLASAVPPGTPCVSGPGRQNTERPATLGFHATTTVDAVGGIQSTFNGNLNDACAGVRLTGSGKLNPSAPPPQAPPTVGGCFGGFPAYQVHDPKDPNNGEAGTFLLVVCDAANGSVAGPASSLAGAGQSVTGDFVFLVVLSGPYEGYQLTGELQNGNVVVLNGGPGI